MRFITRFIAQLWLGAGIFLAAAPALPADRPAHVPARFEAPWRAQERYQRALLQRDGVVGVALGEDAQGQPVLQIFTRDARVAGLPALLDGQRVEVVVTGRFRSGEIAAQEGASAPTDRWPRPVPIGVSAGHQDVTAGTIGCQVFQSSGCHSDTLILSNNHVLANANLGVYGDPVVQPGAYDGGVLPADQIAQLRDFEPVVMATTASNVMDAAIAVTNGQLSDYRTPADGYGAPRTSPVTAYVNQAVRKYGRTSRNTTGRVSAINATVMVDYSAGTAQFVQQLIINGDNSQPFSQPGDSGSLVVVSTGTNARRPVGLIFAGSGTISAANPIGPILQRFAIGISGDL